MIKMPLNHIIVMISYVPSDIFSYAESLTYLSSLFVNNIIIVINLYNFQNYTNKTKQLTI